MGMTVLTTGLRCLTTLILVGTGPSEVLGSHFFLHPRQTSSILYCWFIWSGTWSIPCNTTLSVPLWWGWLCCSSAAQPDGFPRVGGACCHGGWSGGTTTWYWCCCEGKGWISGGRSRTRQWGGWKGCWCVTFRGQEPKTHGCFCWFWLLFQCPVELSVWKRSCCRCFLFAAHLDLICSFCLITCSLSRICSCSLSM